MNLLLVDGTNITMRYAFAQLGERQSHPDDLDIESVCGGVEWALRKVAEQFGATHSVVCFDSEGETWRKAMYPEYKSKRPPGTAAWSKRADEFLAATGWQCAMLTGFEGDDIVATLAHRASAAGHNVLVFSGDCDLLQLLATPRIQVIQFGGNGEEGYVVRDGEWLLAKFDLPSVESFTLYKALVGDSSDGLPGCKGIGPVKASKMLREHGADIEALLGAEIAIDPEQFNLMLSLVSLRTDVPIEPLKPADCRIPGRRSE